MKQKRALLKSISPRDNWTEGDEIIRLHIWGAKNSPNLNLETFISEPSHALENLEYPARSESNSTEQTNKNTLSGYPFFRGKRMGRRGIIWSAKVSTKYLPYPNVPYRSLLWAPAGS